MKYLALFLIGCLVGALSYSLLRRPSTEIIERVDTVMCRMPPMRDTIFIEKRVAVLPRAKKAEEPAAPSLPDNIAVEVPITQARYEGKEYRAWVSGYQPRLDSISLLMPAPKPPKDKHWHLGVSAGCAFTPRGCEPCISIGITYSFLSF